MNETREQLQAIIDGAPDGATHYTDGADLPYKKDEGENLFFWDGEKWRGYARIYSCTRALQDIRDKLELMEEKCALEEKITEFTSQVENLERLNTEAQERIQQFQTCIDQIGANTNVPCCTGVDAPDAENPEWSGTAAIFIRYIKSLENERDESLAYIDNIQKEVSRCARKEAWNDYHPLVSLCTEMTNKEAL